MHNQINKFSKLLSKFIIQSISQQMTGRNVKIVANYQIKNLPTYDAQLIPIFQAYNIKSKKKFSVKKISVTSQIGKKFKEASPKQLLFRQASQQEILLNTQVAILKYLNGQQILKCYEILKTKNSMYYFYDYFPQITLKDLLDFDKRCQMPQIKLEYIKKMLNQGQIIQQTQFLKQQKNQIILQIFQITQSLHRCKIAHNDLILQNIYITWNKSSQQDQFTIKLSGFYKSMYVQNQEYIQTLGYNPYLTDIKSIAKLIQMFGYFQEYPTTHQVKVKQDKLKKVINKIKQNQVDLQNVAVIILQQLKNSFECFIISEFISANQNQIYPQQIRMSRKTSQFQCQAPSTQANDSYIQESIQNMNINLCNYKNFSSKELKNGQFFINNSYLDKQFLQKQPQQNKKLRYSDNQKMQQMNQLLRYSDNKKTQQQDQLLNIIEQKIANLIPLLKLCMFCTANNQSKIQNYFINQNQKINHQIQVSLQQLILKFQPLKFSSKMRSMLLNIKQHKSKLFQVKKLIKSQQFNSLQSLLYSFSLNQKQFRDVESIINNTDLEKFKEKILKKYKEYKDKKLLVNLYLVLKWINSQVKKNSQVQDIVSIISYKRKIQAKSQKQLLQTIKTETFKNISI